MVSALLSGHQPIAERQKSLYDKYNARNLDIQNREFLDANKINNQLENDFYGLIIDQLTGYMFGTNLVYGLDDKKYGESEYTKLQDTIFDWCVKNNVFDLDMETGKFQAITGVAYRLAFINEDGEESVMHLNPWEVIPIGENNRNQYALRYYKTYDLEGREVTKIEFYDNKKGYEYLYFTDPKSQKPVLQLIDSRPHMFDYCPIIKFSNNMEEIGDFEKVETLIESFNRLVSDAQNELEEFRQAYMVFDNDAEITKETIVAARETGAFTLPEGSKAYYLVKDINPNFLELQKDVLEENIYKFAKAIDMKDDSFSGGTQTGESRKWKLLDLENKAKAKERKFETGLREQFKIICSSWIKRGIKVNPYDIHFQFNRTIPKDLSYLADVVTKLNGIVSSRTLISILPFVDDIEYEFEQREIELKSDYHMMYEQMSKPQTQIPDTKEK